MNGKDTGHASRGGWALAAALLSIGCGAGDQTPVDGAVSLQAVLSIDRIEQSAAGEMAAASAMAQFVILPSDADAHVTLDAAGLRTQLPDQKGCIEAALGDMSARDSANGAARRDLRAGELTFPEQLELLEAGEVNIQADGLVTRLALNLFPPSGSASGVIYTTPDQSAAPLPPDTHYAFNATGSEAIPALRIQGQAPSSLRDVTLGGVPLERADSFTAGQPLDLTWTEGEPADRVYIELADLETSILCTFADEDGSGTVPGPLTARLAPDSAVRVSVHRVREAVQAQEMQAREIQLQDRMDALIVEAMVRFDFELTSVLRVE
jgi:hypothetical protein